MAKIWTNPRPQGTRPGVSLEAGAAHGAVSRGSQVVDAFPPLAAHVMGMRLHMTTGPSRTSSLALLEDEERRRREVVKQEEEEVAMRERVTVEPRGAEDLPPDRIRQRTAEALTDTPAPQIGKKRV